MNRLELFLPVNFYKNRHYYYTVKVSLVPTEIGRCMRPINKKPTHFLFQNGELSRAECYAAPKNRISRTDLYVFNCLQGIEIVINYICQVSVISRVCRLTLNHILLLYHIIYSIYNIK